MDEFKISEIIRTKRKTIALIIKDDATLVPILFGQAMGMNPQQLGIFIATVYMITGVATLLQCDSRIGSGLPIVQGSSFSLIPAATAIFDN
ncbi:MAG: hypothetical protein JHC30_07390, partial [Caldisericum sp.]|nr:hypothetical protein [Caldisericum sp.]